MTGLTHEQARRFLHAAIDKCLNAQDRTALDAHLAECGACRAYAAEINWLDSAITHALRSRWSAPHRSPLDMTVRVRHRMWTDAGRRFFLGFAQTFVRLGSLAAILALSLGVIQNQRLRQADEASTAANVSISDRYIGLPTFELETDNELLFLPIELNENEQWLRPALRPNRLRVTQY